MGRFTVIVAVAEVRCCLQVHWRTLLWWS